MKVIDLMAYLKEMDQEADVNILFDDVTLCDITAITAKHEKFIRIIGEVEEINSVIIECQ